MKRQLLSIVAAAVILGGMTAYAVMPPTSPTRANAATQTLTCSTNHWFLDVSSGNQIVGITGNGWHLADRTTAGYPAGDIFKLCTFGNSIYYLQIQDPAPNPGGADWVGVDPLSHYAIRAYATGPGPHEAFTISCVGGHAETLDFVQGGEMFTIPTQGLYAPPQSIGLPGTLYDISSVC